MIERWKKTNKSNNQSSNNESQTSIVILYCAALN